MAKFTIGDLKKIIKEEVRVHLKNKMLSEGRLLNEQDGYTFYTIQKEGRVTFEIAVKGNEIFLVEAKSDGSGFKVGRKIGGGSASDFEAAVDLTNKKVLPGAHNYNIGDMVVQKAGSLAAVSAQTGAPNPVFGFILQNGEPKLYIGSIGADNKLKQLPAFPFKPSDGLAPDKPTTIPTPPPQFKIVDGFNYDKTTLKNYQLLDKFILEIDNYSKELAKNKQKQTYTIFTSASIDNVSSFEKDMTLSVNRANEIKNYILSKLSPMAKSVYVFETKAIGQTDKFDPGKANTADGIKNNNGVRFTPEETANNRVLIIKPVKVK